MMDIRNLVPLALLGFLILGCNGRKENLYNEKYKDELAKHAKSYMLDLKSVLVKNLQNGGPLNAVSVCSDSAYILTQAYSQSNNVEVRRFSFKNRNINNVPSEFESEILREFENLHAQSILTSDSYILETVEEEKVSKIKFIKPLLVEAPCLNCHGDKSQISSEVLALLKENYPNDKATGYKIGDLRGAISVTKSL